MPSNSVTKTEFLKNVYAKSIDFRKNLFTSWIWTRDLLNASLFMFLIFFNRNKNIDIKEYKHVIKQIQTKHETTNYNNN